MSSPISVGVRIMGAGALLLLTLLLVGFLLPSRWEAGASRTIPAPADSVFPLLDSPEGWRRWTPWPEAGLVREGPGRGAGARMAWSDPELGSGSFEIVESDPPTELRYEVQVGEGAMQTRGSLVLSPAEGGVEVVWHEEGDLGWNPLMGYWGLFMEEAQARELAKGLERLEAEVGDPDPAPMNSATGSGAPPPLSDSSRIR